MAVAVAAICRGRVTRRRRRKILIIRRLIAKVMIRCIPTRTRLELRMVIATIQMEAVVVYGKACSNDGDGAMIVWPVTAVRRQEEEDEAFFWVVDFRTSYNKL